MSENEENRGLVLIIDPDQQSSHSTERKLKASGYPSFVSAEIEEGLFKAKIKKPALVLIDIEAGELEGDFSKFSEFPILISFDPQKVDLEQRESLPYPVVNKRASKEEFIGLIGFLIEAGKQEHKCATLLEDLNKTIATKKALQTFIGHDLRNNLIGIINGIELLSLQAESSPDMKEMTDELYKSATVLNYLAGNLVEYSNLSDGEFKFHPSDFELQKLLDEHLPRWRSRSAKHEVVLENEFPRINADREFTMRIFDKLIDNSLKYSQGGKVYIRGVREKFHLKIEIRDEGKGIPREDLSRIFDPFYRSDNAKSRFPDGLGLGLPVAQALVKSQRGEIWAESQENSGTSIFFTLPLYGDIPGSTGTTRRVLIVEDNRLLAKCWARALEREMIEVEWLPDGREALEKAREKIPDLILLDVMLPETDGFTICEKFKNDAELAGVPVYFVSYLSESKDIERAFSLGAQEYLVKSNLTLDNLVEKVKAVFEKEKE